MELGGEQVPADGRAGGGGLDPGAADCAAGGGVAGCEGGGGRPSSSLTTAILYRGLKWWKRLLDCNANTCHDTSHQVVRCLHGCRCIWIEISQESSAEL